MPFLLYGRKTMIWREKDRSKIRAVLMDNIRGLLGIRRRDRIPNALVIELCGVAKWVDEIAFDWFCHNKRMENDRIKSEFGRVWGVT